LGANGSCGFPPDLAYGAKGYPGAIPPERNPDLRRAVGRCEIERLRGNGPRCARPDGRMLPSYALTTLPLRRQEVQTRMCLVAAPTLA